MKEFSIAYYEFHNIKPLRIKFDQYFEVKLILKKIEQYKKGEIL